MSLSVNSTNYQPAFGSSKALNKVGQFAKNQVDHFILQGVLVGGQEIIYPSPNLSTILARKVGIDIGEIIAKFITKKPSSAISEIKIGNQCTNVFAYLADGARALSKVMTKK